MIPLKVAWHFDLVNFVVSSDFSEVKSFCDLIGQDSPFALPQKF